MMKVIAGHHQATPIYEVFLIEKKKK